MNKWILVGIGVLICLAALLGYALSRPKQSDQDQIKQEMTASIEDGKNGQPGSALQMLSDQFTLNGSEESRSAIADAIKKYDPALSLSNEQVLVVDNSGRVTADANLTVGIGPVKTSITIPQVTFLFEKEPDKVFLIFPGYHWLLKGAQVPESSLEQANQSLGNLASPDN